MSYILEALRKMERQKRRDDQAEAWVNEIADEPEEERALSKNPSRILVAASIVFGASGILAGLIFYHGSPLNEKESGNIQPSPVMMGEVRESPNRDRHQNLKPPLINRDREKTSKTGSTSSRGSSLSQTKSTETSSSHAVVRPARLSKKALPTPAPKPQLPPKLFEVIDLTDRYRLTSTGAVNKRRYATIERQDYFIGDTFMGMLITDIKKDRVYLEGEKSKQRYTIVFRYR